MFISSYNKNPMINYEGNQQKDQKYQNLIGSTFSPKCMKNHEKWK